MRIPFIIVTLTVSGILMHSDVAAQKDTTDRIMEFVEQMPVFKAGDLNYYINNRTDLPDSCRLKEGPYVVKFVVDKKGKVRNASVTRGLCKTCDSIVANRINDMPDWVPGKQNGKTVDVLVTRPFYIFRKDVLEFAEQKPEFNGDIKNYLAQNLRYPDSARKQKIEGKVILRLIVNEDGTVSDVKPLRGIGVECDKEAVRVVKAMPPWKPAKQNGKPVNCYYTLVIEFKLD